MSRHQSIDGSGWIDRLAITLSGLCLIHCIATLLLLSLVASIGGLLANPLIHEVGLAMAMGLGLVAFVKGLMTHGQRGPLIIGAMGLASMAYALSIDHGSAGEVIFTVFGVALVAVGHVLNRRAHALVAA